MKELFEHYETFAQMYSISTEIGRKRVDQLAKLLGDYLNLPEKALVLDVGCAGGVSTLAAIKSGFRAVGMDFRFDAIDEGKKNFEKENLPAFFVCADARKMPFKESAFDAAIFLFNPLPHWSMEDFLAICRQTEAVLKEGGVCFIEFHDFLQTIFDGKWRETLVETIPKDRVVISIQKSFNTNDGTSERFVVNIENSQVRATTMHLWGAWMIKFVLEIAGFVEIEIISYSAGFPRKVIIAKKRFNSEGRR